MLMSQVRGASASGMKTRGNGVSYVALKYDITNSKKMVTLQISIPAAQV